MSPSPTVPVQLNVPQAEKDLIDAGITALNDLKSGKSGSLVNDLLPSAIKIFGELQNLGEDLKSKQSVDAILYLEKQLASVFITPASA